MMVNFGIGLDTDFESSFKKHIVKEVKSRISSSINNITESIEVAIQKLVQIKLHNAPEVDSLAGGKLRYHFGLIDGASRISNIIDAWADSIEVKYVSSLGSLGGIQITMTKGETDVLDMPESFFETEKGTRLEWLKWLLMEGDTRIVSNYNFHPGKRGRAGGGIMVSRQSGSWGVPSEFAGTLNNNFATRALEGLHDEIDVIVRREITKVI